MQSAITGLIGVLSIFYYWFSRCTMPAVFGNNTGIINTWIIKGARKKIATVEMWLYKRLAKVSRTERKL